MEMTDKKEQRKEKYKRRAKKLLQCILNPRLLFCFAIAWIITNGWSYVMLAVGTALNIQWMMAVSGAYLAFLWFPFSPEKIATFAIAIALLRWLFPKDQRTLAVLRGWYATAKRAIRKRRKGDLSRACSLIAMDLDGTLNNDQKVITPKTLKVLMEAQYRGIRLVLASARPSPGLFRERDALQLRQNKGILMSYNGGRIVDAATGKVLYETAMDMHQAKQILRKLEGLPVTPILDDGVQFYVTDPQGFKVDYECKNNAMECTRVENLADWLPFAPVKILMSVEPAQLQQVQQEIAGFLPPELTVVQTAPFYLEVIPRSINKGWGLEKICQLLNIPLEETVAFGDAENDIPMLKSAGLGVAMGNATAAAKAAADHITYSNNHDGIAVTLDAVMN